MSGRTCFVDRIVLGLCGKEHELRGLIICIPVDLASHDSWKFLARFRKELGKHVLVFFENEVKCSVKFSLDV